MTGRDQSATLHFDPAALPADAGLTAVELAYIQGSIAAMSGGSTVPMGQAWKSGNVAAFPDEPASAEHIAGPADAGPPTNELAEHRAWVADYEADLARPRTIDRAAWAGACGDAGQADVARRDCYEAARREPTGELGQRLRDAIGRQGAHPNPPGTMPADPPGGDADSRDTPRLMTVP